MSNFNDQKYIDKIIKGDTKSYEVLVNQYKNMVFSLALQMLKNREEAEEVSQDTFIKAYRFLHKFKGDSKFSTWLYKISYNTCLDALKKHKKERQVFNIDNITENQIQSLDNVLNDIEIEERNEIIKKCILQLPENDRILLNLYYYKELSLQEIAEVVTKNYSQVRVNLYRSRKRLASVLKDNLASEIIESYGR
jgi:RNA polymerase sigma-70 factor (ECF subfamily)